MKEEKEENTDFRKSGSAKEEKTVPEKSSSKKEEKGKPKEEKKAEEKKGDVKEKTEKREKPKAKRIEKNKEAVLAQEMIKKKKKPSFRGRFGKKWLRRKKKEKWNKWRKPRGIDIKRKKEDGAIPKSGYRTRKKIRFVHPSGMNEVRVQNVKELNEVKKGFVVRIGGKVGKKNKKIMIAKAKEMGLRLLN